MLMKIKMTLRYLVVTLLISLSAASCGNRTSEEYPMFWTWMEDREDLDLDSLFVHLKESGIDGLMLYVPEVEDYRRAAQLAKENDITLYAWIWTLRPRGDRDVLLQEHPEWFDYNLKGECLTDIKAYLDSYKFLNPAVPGVHDYVRENVRRVCEIEGIEGICLDYCRIVDRVLPISLSYKYDKVQDAEVFDEYDFGYHPVALEKFMGEYGYDPRLTPDPSRDSLWCSFREKLITDVANVAAETAHSYGKKVCASPFVCVQLASFMVGQNYAEWDLDLVFPMAYSDFYSMEPGFVYDAVRHNCQHRNPETEIYCGLGAELGGTFEDLIENMDAAFSAGARGISLYTVAGLDTKEKRSAFKAYADRMRENGGEAPAPDYVPAGEISLDPFTHPRLMQIVERTMQRLVAGENIRDRERYSMNGIVADDESKTYPDLDLSDYQLVRSDDRVLVYNVADKASGSSFDVVFTIYGGLISGWDVRCEK